MKEEILDLFFNQKMKQNEIATKLNIAKSTVSKIVGKDTRFIDEKSRRKAVHKLNHNKDIQTRVENKRKQIQFQNSVDNLIIKHLHTKASIELSKRIHLTNENYRKWNSSAYNYNPSKRRFEFDENLGRSADVPKYINDRR